MDYEDKKVIIQKKPKQVEKKEDVPTSIKLSVQQGRKIVLGREAKKLNQKEFGALIKKNQAYVKDLEKGNISIDIKLMQDVEKALGIKL